MMMCQGGGGNGGHNRMKYRKSQNIPMNSQQIHLRLVFFGFGQVRTGT